MEVLIFANSAALPLAQEMILLSQISQVRDPIFRLGEAVIAWFPDGEPWVEIKDQVRGRKVVVIGGLGPATIKGERRSVNDSFMQTKVLLRALSSADANILTLIIPYCVYARQDRFSGKESDRTAITARLAADEMVNAVLPPGLARVFTIEPHFGQLAGYFNTRYSWLPVVHLFTSYVRQVFSETEQLVVVAPDQGATGRASAYATAHGVPRPIAYLDKRRLGPGQSKVIQIIGEVDGCDAVIIDDIIDGGGTICEAAITLRARGARRIMAIAAHGLFSGEAIHRLLESELEQILVLDTIRHDLSPVAARKIRFIPTAPLLLEATNRLIQGDSIRAIGSPDEDWQAKWQPRKTEKT